MKHGVYFHIIDALPYTMCGIFYKIRIFGKLFGYLLFFQVKRLRDVSIIKINIVLLIYFF